MTACLGAWLGEYDRYRLEQIQFTQSQNETIASFPVDTAIGVCVTSATTPRNGRENWTLCYVQVDDTTGSLLIQGNSPRLEVWVEDENGIRKRARTEWGKP